MLPSSLPRPLLPPLQAKKDAKEAERSAARRGWRRRARRRPPQDQRAVKEAELLKAHGKIREHFSTRFNDVRRGFRLYPRLPGPPSTAPLSPPLPPS